MLAPCRMLCKTSAALGQTSELPGGNRILFKQHQRYVRRRGRPGHRHARISAKANDERHIGLTNEPLRPAVAGEILLDESPSASRPGQRMRREPADARNPPSPPACALKGFMPVAIVIWADGRRLCNCSATARPGEQVPAGAAAGENDMRRVCIHRISAFQCVLTLAMRKVCAFFRACAMATALSGHVDDPCPHRALGMAPAATANVTPVTLERPCG